MATDTKGYYPSWKPMTRGHYNDTQHSSGNVMFVTITGDEARRVEKLDEETIKDEIQ